LKGTESNAACLSSPDGELHLRVESALKVAGSFRTPWGLQTFCITRSSLSTLKKQGRELLPSLEATFNGDDPLMGLDI
jgi:hypothetical protein